MRTITATGYVLITDDIIICNSSSEIFLNLPKSTASNHELIIKNIGSGTVYLSPVNGDAIDSGGSLTISQWEAVKLSDDILGTWLITPYQVVSDIVGANPTPQTRTNNPIVAGATVNSNIDRLDTAIGADVQINGYAKNITEANTVIQNLQSLDTYKSVRTIKKTIGAPSFGGVDYNFTSAANQSEQVITMTDIIPAKARLVDIFICNDAVFSNAVSMAADVGTTSGGNELISSGQIYNVGNIIAAANAGAFILKPSATATTVYVNATPGANWNAFVAGSVSVYITVIDVMGV